ncbi:hypothetical protein HDU67_004377 [Dinochytrium kinnereticum]|nr:hypothetical protein HDU67_004377 [Dinochytrium kinnereticum]
MSQVSSELIRVATMQLVYTAGFDRTNQSATVVLSDMMSKYLERLAGQCSRVAAHQQRTAVHFDDLIRALSYFGVDLESLKEYGLNLMDSDNATAASNDVSTGHRTHFPRPTPKHIPACP